MLTNSKNYANIKLLVGSAVFLFIASPLVCADSVTAFPISHRTGAFLLKNNMPKGLQGFQKGHLGFKKHITVFCKIKDCNEKHFARGLCKKHYGEQYQQEHKEQIAVQVKKYAKINKEKINKKNRLYYIVNRKKELERAKIYRQTPAGKASAKAGRHNRRTLEKGLTLAIIQSVYETNITLYGRLTCYLCFKPIVNNDDSIDHSTPLIRKGSNKYENLGVAHLNCNIRKHTMTLEEWFKTKKEKRKC